MEINSKKAFMEFDQKIAFLVQLLIWAKNGNCSTFEKL